MATHEKLHSGPKRRRFGRSSGPAGTQGLRAIVSDDVRLMIEGHVLASPELSVSGVLVGHMDGPGGKPQVTGLIESPPSPVKFTLRVWERIQERHRNEHPGTELVGWYQSRAGAGMVFTQHDGLVHSKFFGEPGQFAYMVDPELRKEGVFGWRQGEIVLLAEGPMAARSAKDAPAPALAPDIAAAVAAQTAERADGAPAPTLVMPAASPQSSAPAPFGAPVADPAPLAAAQPEPANTVRMADPEPAPRATVRMAAPAAAKRPPSRRARGLAWGAGAALILAAGASAVALGRWDTSRTEAEQAVVPKVAVPVAAAATPAATPVTDTAAIAAAQAAADKVAAAKAARHQRALANRAREQRARDRRQAARRASARRAAARRAAAARAVAARRRTTTVVRAPVTTTRAPVTRQAPVVAARKPSAPAKSTNSGGGGGADPGNAANVSVVPPVD